MPDAQRRAEDAHEEDHPASAHAQDRVSGPAEYPSAGAEPGAAIAPGQDWPVPAATGPVHAVVTLPGSKSITNRALILAALADGPGLIRRPLRARDTLLMAAALRGLGTDIEELAKSPDGRAAGPCWRVTPCLPGAATAQRSAGVPAAGRGDGHPRGGPSAVDVGNAGTVLRFVPPVATLGAGDVSFDGDPRARERPVGPLLTALRELGACIDDGGRGALPFTVHGRGAMPGGAITLDASGSSQLVSALLLAGPRFDKGVEVHHQGPPVPSAPHVEMTVGMLRDAAVRVEVTGRDSWRVHPGPPHPRTVDVEPDLSNAAPFLAAALVTGGRPERSSPVTRCAACSPGWVVRANLAQPG